MFRYKIHWADGSEAGEAEYAVNINAGELIWLRGNRRVRVLDLVPVSEGLTVRRAAHGGADDVGLYERVQAQDPQLADELLVVAFDDNGEAVATHAPSEFYAA